MGKYVGEIDGVKFTEYQLKTIQKITKSFGEFTAEVEDERDGSHGRCYDAYLHIQMIDWPDGSLQFRINPYAPNNHQQEKT